MNGTIPVVMLTVVSRVTIEKLLFIIRQFRMYFKFSDEGGADHSSVTWRAKTVVLEQSTAPTCTGITETILSILFLFLHI